MKIDRVELAEKYSHLDKGVENLTQEGATIALREYEAFIAGMNAALKIVTKLDSDKMKHNATELVRGILKNQSHYETYCLGWIDAITEIKNAMEE